VSGSSICHHCGKKLVRKKFEGATPATQYIFTLRQPPNYASPVRLHLDCDKPFMAEHKHLTAAVTVGPKS
jgi:hypothetical protein